MIRSRSLRSVLAALAVAAFPACGSRSPSPASPAAVEVAPDAGEGIDEQPVVPPAADEPEVESAAPEVEPGETDSPDDGADDGGEGDGGDDLGSDDLGGGDLGTDDPGDDLGGDDLGDDDPDAEP